VENTQRLKSKELFPPVFSRHALAYKERLEGIMSRGESVGRMRVLELIDAQPGMRILDLACGPGTLSGRLAAAITPDGEVVGVDLAPGMIALAEAGNIHGARFELMDIGQLAFPDKTFDAAACGHGLHFVPDLPPVLREARRVLRQGSRFAASVPISARNESPAWSVLDSVMDRWLPPATEVVDLGPTRELLRNGVALKQAALDAGFATARVELLEEIVRWESAEHMVSSFMGWVDYASRLEGADDLRRQAIREDAIESLLHDYPGAIETKGRNHVLFAQP
jgi:ubiquinone/menaquinone biosynthesis C-methylase UbiE